MYLRTILELEEEGVTPLRARIAERLHQSGPTVSQTVGRMERDGLVTVEGDRHLQLTDLGRHRAVSVMRKHRLAELLLVNVIGLEYEAAHLEACRWEHVMSDEVERKVYQLLGHPTVSPYGNHIPGLAELDKDLSEDDDTDEPVLTLSAAPLNTPVVIRRISEQLQKDTDLIHELHVSGIEPGAVTSVNRNDDAYVLTTDERTVEVPTSLAGLIFVSAQVPAATA